MSPRQSNLVNRKGSLGLSEKEGLHLRSGDDGEERDSRFKTRIEEKVGRLPERFETLYADIELLFDGGYLDPETWAEPWMQWHFGEDPTRQDLATAYGDPGGGSVESPSTTLGREFGCLARRIMLLPHPDYRAEQEVWQDLIWGFIQGVHFDHRPAAEVTGRVRREETAHLMEGLLERAEATADADNTRHGDIARDASRVERQRSKTRAHIETCLDAHGVEPGHWAVDQVLKAVWNHHREVDRIEGRTLPEDWTPEEDVPESLVGDIAAKNHLAEKQQVRKYLETDYARLDTSWRGVNRRKIFDTVVENGPCTHGQIQSEFPKEDPNGVTRVLKDLSGIGKGRKNETEYLVCTDRPLITDGRDSWQPTNYGTTLAQYSEEIECLTVDDEEDHVVSPALFFSGGVSDDALMAAADELGLVADETGG